MAFVALVLVLVLALALAGCGGRSEGQSSTSIGGSEAASGSAGIAVAGSSAGGSTPGVGPIDATGLPKQLAVDCPGIMPPQLALPCRVGGSLVGPGAVEGPGGINVLECYDLAGEDAAASGGSALPVISTTIPFGDLPTMLNQPAHIPFPLPQVPGALSLTGTVVFSQVDPAGRAFVARLTGGTFPWMGVTCAIPDTPFWAVRGDFI